MYIYDYEDLIATSNELNVSVEVLARENWTFDGIFGYDGKTERWVSPSGDYILLSAKN